MATPSKLRYNGFCKLPSEWDILSKFKKFYEGTYARYILPGVLLQSVLIGGGYATGREIYSYGAKFGAMGWIAGLTIGIGFALFAFLTFEICRIYKVYDYKNYIKQVIGPLWPSTVAV